MIHLSGLDRESFRETLSELGTYLICGPIIDVAISCLSEQGFDVFNIWDVIRGR